MSASEHDSRVLDRERRLRDDLQAENKRLIERLKWVHRNRENRFRRIRDIMEEKE